MPNWCQNHLTIDGPRDQLVAFRDAAKMMREDGKLVPFQIGQIVPEPPKGDPRCIPSERHQGGWDWYSWRVQNWGSKWDVCDVTLKEDGDRLVYAFDSAWAPPREGIRRVSMAFPALTLTYAWFEWGMQFYGRDEIRNGELTNLLEVESIPEGAYEYDDDDEVQVVDPDLREFVDAYGFGFYA